MRLIDADTLYDKIEDIYKSATPPDRLIWRTFLDMIADASTIDAVPVVHGRWVYEGFVGDNDYFRCTYCGTMIRTDVDNRDYCPSCKAKMDEEEKENEML